MRVLLDAVLDKVTTLKDRSVKLIFETQELGDDSCAKIFSMRSRIGWLLFASDDESVDNLEAEIPKDRPKSFENDRSQSEILRTKIYILWKEMGSPGNFDDFKRPKMETVIRWFDDLIERAKIEKPRLP